MKDLFTVMCFSIKEMVTKKAFIISTIIIMALIIIACNIPNIIKKFAGEDGFDEKILIIDEENIFEDNLKSLETLDTGYKFEIQNKKVEFDEIKQKIENNDIDGCIKITKKNNLINLEYIVESMNTINGQVKIPSEIIEGLTKVYTNMQIMKLNLTQQQLESITPQFGFNITQTAENKANGAVFLMMALSMILFFAVFFCASKVSTSVTTEKTSKIMETLVTSTSPKNIILGKTFGIGLVGLLQLILLLATGVISANLFMDKEILGHLIDLSNVTVGLGLVTLLYFVLGYFIFAFIFALTGSAVANPEDAQSAQAPASMLGVAGFYIAYFSMMNPVSNISTFSMYFPFSAPFSVPLRMLLGIATTSEVLISVTIMMLTIAIIAKISIKVYSSAILNYGSKLSFKELIKLAKRKD